MADRNAIGQAFRDLPHKQITSDSKAPSPTTSRNCRQPTGKWQSAASAGVVARRFALQPTIQTSKRPSFFTDQRRPLGT